MVDKNDFIGQENGHLKVISKYGKNENGKILWKCYCSACGGEYISTKDKIMRKAKNKSCGCMSGKMKDLTGQKFGKLSVISYYGSSGEGALWLCKCDCGKDAIVLGKKMIHGDMISCGCMRKPYNLVGSKFGRLTVISRAESKNGKTYWNCICDCGNKKITSSDCLKRGITNSCGCLKREKAKELFSTSRAKDHRLYNVWHSMKNRCCSQKNKSYSNYGGRGIKVCDEWSNDYEKFYAWAMSNGYRHGLEIDRIDVDGNYCPENCRWVDKVTQANNKRNNKKYEMNGESKTIAEWCREYNLDYFFVRQRVEKLGWTIEQALTIAACK